ncbi:hypothetical protein [Trinickia mobilis]|uniref:hypothetical protein n=1 Tax=Trinickia mobilis TaxID=2816356 RepID=UPI001A8C356C|nr:hypothetical protein [Trinickia mobilis]
MTSDEFRAIQRRAGVWVGHEDKPVVMARADGMKVIERGAGFDKYGLRKVTMEDISGRRFVEFEAAPSAGMRWLSEWKAPGKRMLAIGSDPEQVRKNAAWKLQAEADIAEALIEAHRKGQI